jgi:hypothetical protein
MSDKHSPSSTEEPGFFDKKHNVDMMLRVFYVICGFLVLMDFIVHRHIYVEFEELPTFYALYGFVACVVLVVLAKQLRVLLMRTEDYYQDNLSKTDDKK